MSDANLSDRAELPVRRSDPRPAPVAPEPELFGRTHSYGAPTTSRDAGGLAPCLGRPAPGPGLAGSAARSPCYGT